tara:strand:+ start:2132 stop:2494 length:363 start_codon:yes stop_codon:yes gene_type:complete
MKTLQEENIKQLTESLLDLIAKTSVELGHRADAQTMASLAKILAEDLKKENRFKRMYLNQIIDAFYMGVRYSDFEPFLNIRTFYRWILQHKKRISDAIYRTETLKQKNVEFYQPQLKQIK